MNLAFLLVPAWVFAEQSSLVPQSKKMDDRLNGISGPAHHPERDKAGLKNGWICG